MAIFIHIWNGGEDWKTPNSYRLCQNWELGRKSSPVNVVISGTGMEVVTLPIPQAHLEWDRLLPDSNLHALSCRNSCHMHPALPRQQDKRRKLKPFGEGGKRSGNSRRKQRYCGKKTRIQWWGKCKDPQKAQIPPQRGEKKKKKPKPNGCYILLLLSSSNSCSSASTVFSALKTHPICHKQVSLVPFQYYCLYH